MQENAGTQLDPNLVRVFLDIRKRIEAELEE